MLKQKLVIISIAMVLAIIAGCKTNVISRTELATQIDAIYMNTMHRGVYYTGSDSQCHFIIVKRELEIDKTFCLLKAEVYIPASFSVTKDDKKWLELMPELKGQVLEGYKLLFTEKNKNYLIQQKNNNS